MTIPAVWGVFVGEGGVVAGVEVARAGPGVFVGGMAPPDALGVGVPDALGVGVPDSLDSPDSLSVGVGVGVLVPPDTPAVAVGVMDPLDALAVAVGVMDPLDALAVGVSVGPGVGDAQGASGIRVKKTLLSTSPLPPTSETEAVTSGVPVCAAPKLKAMVTCPL
jgi:hypothetical protein